MALKLFRTTGYSTILMPGETKLARHPASLVLLASLWIGLACNVGIWRLLAGQGPVRNALAAAAVLAGGTAVVLSALGWRRTIKLATTVLLLAAALVAAGLWVQQLPVESLWLERPRALFPAWPNFLSWQVPVLLLVLAVVPVVWVWNTPLRRLPGPAQMRATVLGVIAGALLFATGLLLQH